MGPSPTDNCYLIDREQYDANVEHVLSDLAQGFKTYVSDRADIFHPEVAVELKHSVVVAGRAYRVNFPGHHNTNHTSTHPAEFSYKSRSSCTDCRGVTFLIFRLCYRGRQRGLDLNCR
jgi:hypothetical protein